MDRKHSTYKRVNIIEAVRIIQFTHIEPHRILITSPDIPSDFFLRQMQTPSIIRRTRTGTGEFLLDCCQCVGGAEASVSMTRLDETLLDVKFCEAKHTRTSMSFIA